MGLNINDNNKYNLLKIFLENFYKETNKNQILIKINQKEDFNTYYSVLNLINKEIREQFIYDIDISSLIKINENKDIILKLFNLITFKNIKLRNIKNKNKFIEIQNYFIKSNIKICHKYIWSQNKSLIEKAKKYFNTYKNCLLGINNNKCLPLCENNKESITIIDIPSYSSHVKKFDYNNFKLKKIKVNYITPNSNNALLNYKNIDNLEEISGIRITKKNINQWIEKINNMENLKKISNIQFDNFCERLCESCGKKNLVKDKDMILCSNCGIVIYDYKEEDYVIEPQLFQDFFIGIKKTHSNKIISITTENYIFRKGKDFEFILNNFPNVRKIQEDKQNSQFDEKIKINKILSCYAEKAFQENDLCAITKMVKNYIKQKNPGENGIQFYLDKNYERMAQLFKYWNNNNEKQILEKIDYITFINPAKLNGNEKIQLNKINRIGLFTESDKCFLHLLKDVKNVNQIIIKDKKLFDKNLFDFIKEKNICYIILDIEDLKQDECENFIKVKKDDYFILDDELFKNKEFMNKIQEEYKLKVIPKLCYVNYMLVQILETY